jgi:hypothetical protein
MYLIVTSKRMIVTDQLGQVQISSLRDENFQQTLQILTNKSIFVILITTFNKLFYIKFSKLF